MILVLKMVFFVLPGSCSIVLVAVLAAGCMGSVLGWPALGLAAACSHSRRLAESRQASRPRWPEEVRPFLEGNPVCWTASEAGPRTCLQYGTKFTFVRSTIWIFTALLHNSWSGTNVKDFLSAPLFYHLLFCCTADKQQEDMNLSID